MMLYNVLWFYLGSLSKFLHRYQSDIVSNTSNDPSIRVGRNFICLAQDKFNIYKKAEPNILFQTPSRASTPWKRKK